MAGRVYHWKHGWIPITPEAKAYAAGEGPKPKKSVRKAPGSIEPGGVSFTKQQHYGKVVDPVGDRLARDEKAGKPSGVFWLDNPEYDGDVDTPERRRSVVKTIHEFQERFPGLKGPIPTEIISRTQMEFDENAGPAWGITNIAPPHEVKINESVWDDYDVRNKLSQMDLGDGPGGRHGYAMVGAQAAKTPAQFRRTVILHELGHYMHMQNQQKYGALPGEASASSGFGPMDWLANEPVTPRQMGFTDVASDSHALTSEPSPLDQEVPRWQADSLDWRSQYAMGQNQYEWFAEALLDGMVNGENATDSGKRALEIATKEYG